MIEIKPLRIPGRWKEGFALDEHTLDSIYKGDDEYGHPIFDTTRTDIGEHMYRLKYRSDLSVVNEIIFTAGNFLSVWRPPIDLIIPVPPSRAGRQIQPVFILAETLSKTLNIPYTNTAVTRVKDIPELKDIYNYDERLQLLEGAHAIQNSITKGKRILLFDDLFRSGATMNAITANLYDFGMAVEVFALSITRTRSNK